MIEEILKKVEDEFEGPSSDNNSVAWKAGGRYALQRVREEVLGIKPEP